VDTVLLDWRVKGTEFLKKEGITLHVCIEKFGGFVDAIVLRLRQLYNT
jgi:hypothetical protein